jgi:hypothetical protein
MTTRLSILPLVLLLLFGNALRAFPYSPASSLVEQILSVSIPDAEPALPMDTQDYTPIWAGDPLPGVTFSLQERSIQWVRVSERLVLPRALLIVSVNGVTAGDLIYAGFSHPMTLAEGSGTLSLPVALISGEQNQITIRLRQNESPAHPTPRPLSGQIALRYHPRQIKKKQITIAPSCSPFRVETSVTFSMDQWLYLSCQPTYVQGEGDRKISLTLLVFWDHGGSSITINGMETPAAQPALWRLKLSPSDAPLTLQGGPNQSETVRIQYFLPEKTHRAFLGAGIGPYSYLYVTPGGEVDTSAAILTLYGSYKLGETSRLVFFDATPLRKSSYSDLGVYLNYETARVLDQQIIISLLIGGHFLVFSQDGQVVLSWSTPQGIEFTCTDFYKKRHTLFGGALLLPESGGQKYQNVWLRWGPSNFFVELNFIGWSEPVGKGLVKTKSLGVSVGGPIGLFF